LARAALVTLGAGTVAVAPGCTLLPKDHGALDASADGDLLEDDDSGLVGTFYGSISGMIDQCTTVQDCQTVANDAVCCVQERCLAGASAMNVSCPDPEVQLIKASNYDQSCVADSDCVAVAAGNFCIPGAGNCANAAINKSAQTRYQSDVANTNAAFCSAPGNCATFACGTSPGPWCLNGTCEIDTCPPDDAGTDGPYPGDGEEAGD